MEQVKSQSLYPVNDRQGKDNVFSVYLKPIKTNKVPQTDTTLDTVFKAITDSRYRESTTKVRQAQSKQERNELKATLLDYVTFSGRFKERGNKHLIRHSQLICIDIDDITDVSPIKEQIVSILPPALMFTSPSGNGLKVIYKIATAEGTHLAYFKALEQFFLSEINLAIDKSGKDIARACFLCHDPKAYYNKDSRKLDQAFIDTFPAPAQTPTKTTVTDYTQIIDNLKKWLNRSMAFVSGQRNKYITTLAHAYNRYGIPVDVAEYDLLQFEQSDFRASEIRATVKSIYGQYSAQHGTQVFEINTPYTFAGIPKKKETTPLLPIDSLPVAIQSFINEYTQVYQVPRDYIAGSIITATALAVGNRLELKDKYSNIPIIWLAIVGDVSSGKTDPLRTALHSFIRQDVENNKKYKEEAKRWREYEALPKKQKETAIPVNEPECKQSILIDYTPESLRKVHESNPNGILILRDELKGLLDDYGRYNKNGEQSVMLSTFSRQPLIVNRVGRKDPIVIPDPVILMAGGIQPDLLPSLAEDKRAESGFLARFLFVFPDKVKKPKYSKDKMNPTTLAGFYKFLEDIQEIPETVDLSLSNEAEELYRKWYNNNAEEIDNEETGYLKGVYGKFDIIVLRLAIVIKGMNIYYNRDLNTQITAKEMQGAIDLIEYFRHTALKVFEKIFKNRPENKVSKTDIIKHLSGYGASQNEIANAVKVSQPYVNKILKNI